MLSNLNSFVTSKMRARAISLSIRESKGLLPLVRLSLSMVFRLSLEQ